MARYSNVKYGVMYFVLIMCSDGVPKTVLTCDCATFRIVSCVMHVVYGGHGREEARRGIYPLSPPAIHVVRRARKTFILQN